MGLSKLKIPKVCEHCGKAFEAKTVITRYCSKNCSQNAKRKEKKQALEEKHKQQFLQDHKMTIATIQTRPYISISEAVVLFGISKDTIRRLIKAKKIPAVNLGHRLTRISRTHVEAMFTAVTIPEEKPQEQQPVKLQYETSECYTIGEITKKFGMSPKTVESTIRRFSIPKRQVGSFVYVPKEMIDKIFNKK
jgi:excisionase family DNA binding protein